ncbi:MAG: sterol desaturase family protein, partial [Novosphingobium sp.]
EVDEEPIRYGIVRQLGTFNLLYSVFHEWIGMAKDVWQAPWRHKLSYLWREPGWSHDGSRDTSDRLRERWRARQVEPAE